MGNTVISLWFPVVHRNYALLEGLDQVLENLRHYRDCAGWTVMLCRGARG